jgi:hypothetical protein
MSILEDAAHRRLRIECSEISLTKGGPAPLSFKGPGTVWIDEGGQIHFEFSLHQEENRGYDMAVVRQAHQVPEEPRDEDYFALTALTALSCSGEVYQGRVLYPEWADKPGVGKGKLTQLQSTRQLSGEEPSVARILIPTNIDFPQIQHLEGLSPKNYCGLNFGNGEKIELFDKGNFTEIVCSVQPRHCQKPPLAND